jgi:hypothetical protein
VARDYFLGEREPHPRAPFLGGEERVEDLLAQILGNAGPGVGDRDRVLAHRPRRRRGGPAIGADPHRSGGWIREPRLDAEEEPRGLSLGVHRLECVQDQVGHDATQQLGIDLELGQVRREAALDFARERHPPRGGAQRLLDQLPDVDRTARERDRPHELEARGDRIRHRAQLAPQLGEQRQLLGPILEAPLQQPREHLHARERVADLMRHSGGHLPQRGEPLAQPLLLVASFEGREVAEEDRRAANPARVAHRSQREADVLASRPASSSSTSSARESGERPSSASSSSRATVGCACSTSRRGRSPRGPCGRRIAGPR